MTPEDMREKATALFKKRFHCSQAILTVGLEKIGEKDTTAIKAVGAFGGGIAGSGSTCGTLLGAVASISALYSRGTIDEKENPRMWSCGKKLIAEFEKLTESFAGSNCRDITGIDWTDHGAVKEYYSNPESSRKRCVELVGEFAYILGTILEREQKRLS